MSKKNKSLTSQALLEMSQIQNSIREESKSTLKDLLAEAVKDALRDEAMEEDKDEDVNDGKKSPVKRKQGGKDELPEGANGMQDMQQEVPGNPEDEAMQAQAGAQEVPQQQEAGMEGGNGEDEWSQMNPYKGEDGSEIVDLTSEKDMGKVLKAYKLLTDDDDIVVQKNGDMVQIQDNEAGTEYIIDLGGSDVEPTAEGGYGEEMTGDELNESAVFELETDDDYDDLDEIGPEEPEDDSDVVVPDLDLKSGFEDEDAFEDPEQANDLADNVEDMDLPDLSGGVDVVPDNEANDDDDYQLHGILEAPEVDDYLGDEPAGGIFESSNARTNNKNKTRKSMKEGKMKKQVLFEVDLGYTDKYQDKDPIEGLSNNEPSKSGRSWHKGVPTGTEKPWAGETKSKGDPFKKTEKVEGSVNEETEEVFEEPVEEATNVGGAVQQRTNSKSHIPANREGNTPEVTRHASVGGDYKEKLEEALRKLQKENKMLKEGVKELRKGLNEAHVVNVSLGKITKLFLENTTTGAEKREIVNRFANEAKTVEQSKALYESISRQLNSSCGKDRKSINEQSMKVDSQSINESRNNVPNEFRGMLDLIDRMGNL